MFFPESELGDVLYRERAPVPVPDLRRRLPCAYLLSPVACGSTAHPMGANEAAARWHWPARRSFVRRS
jgi:hypothetical protein